MPSLRQSKRKSRTSTPYATPHDTHSPPSDPKKEKTQSLLDTWIEPPPKNPAPSFEEHGFARHGVLETMAPLGALPTARLKNRVRSLPDAATRFGRTGDILASDEVASTPEMTPGPELDRDDSERQEEEEQPVDFSAHDEDEDDDYVPGKSKAKLKAAKTPVRGKTPVQSKTPVHSKTPVKNGFQMRSTAPNSPTMHNATPRGGDVPVSAARQRLQIAVNDALVRSQSNNRPNIGRALQQLHEDSKTDQELYEVLNSILHQNSTPQQFVAFRVYIKSAKKRYKKEAKAREIQETLHVRQASPYSLLSPPFFSATPDQWSKFDSPSQSARASEPTSSTALLAADTVNLITGNVTSAQLDPSDIVNSREVTPDLGYIPALSAKRSPSPHGPRMPSKSPRKQLKLNGDTAPAQAISTDLDVSTKAPATAAKTSDGAQSDSDLSDVNEEIVQNGPPEPLPVNGNGNVVFTPVPIAKKVKGAGLRASTGKKSRANSVKPNGRFDKKAPPTAQELAEEAELQRKREEMAERQASRMPYDPPISDARFEDEMLETESLTESQIAVGPPYSDDQPRRAGRAPRPGMTLHIGKRLREDNSALPSPRLDSAATTRPSTPAIAPPPAKRLKLTNGQGARTKRSPVKNRDGPIAGIAHTGGGGSRQLGPDDNDPGSPPSESDDFCSACKGAGEFVCCETCPRVFHFLCCDPPLPGPPDGPFYCQECEAKLNPIELLEESYQRFGPLFKQLRSTNPRSFALPVEVQGFFETVSARADGSYFEEVKKYPLAKNSGYGFVGPDYLRTHDTDHKPILCVQCGKSAAGKRQVLKCDFCHAYWHLDCCDPPLANPPHISLEASTRDAWKCPRHVDHDLRSGQLAQNDLNAFDTDDDVVMVAVSALGRVPRKIRKPRRSSIVEPTFSRGMRNNGIIEVMNDPDDETDGEGNYVFSTEESKDFNSKTYRIPEKGIIVDFIDKVKVSRIEQKRRAQRAAKADTKRRTYQQQFAIRPINEQQAALHLAQLANKEEAIGLNQQSIDALILNLTAEAPESVVSALNNAPPGPMTEAKRKELLKLRALIDRALES